MKAVILWELLRRRWFVVWWSVGISAMVGLTAIAYRSINAQSIQSSGAFTGIEQSTGSFFGGSDFFSAVGYLSSQIYYVVLPILVIVMVVTLVSGLMARDENDATVELTLARPISRLNLLIAKAIVAALVVLAIGAVTCAVMLVAVRAGGIEVTWSHLVLTHLLSFAFGSSFGVISFMLTAANRWTRKVAGVVAVAISLGGYIVASLSGLVDWLKWPAKFMPYHYYDTVALLNGHIDKGLLWYIAGCFIVAAIVSVLGYTRRDIG